MRQVFFWVWAALFSVALLGGCSGGADGRSSFESKDKPMGENDTHPVVTMKTTMGDITIELWPEHAPKTVANFLAYVDAGFYDGTIFHRVIEDFMIQGGGFTPEMEKKPTRASIVNEATNRQAHLRGTVAMARTNEVDSATSQFFINVKNNPNLNHRDESPRGFGYCVFGRVIDGMDVVDRIRKTATHRKGMFDDVPVETVTIEEVRRIDDR
jgi:cyclophilin family peptidyl-prolyl cis-trans isomerase